MQVTETLSEGLKHEFKVSVPATDLDAKADARLVDLKDKVRLNGFRPGKVPVAHLKKIYGRSVMAETIDETIRDTNTKIFTERGFRLASEPKVTMPTEQKEVEELLSGKTEITAHFTSLEMSGRFIAALAPLNILYRPSKNEALSFMMLRRRTEDPMQVRQLSALRADTGCQYRSTQ